MKVSIQLTILLIFVNLLFYACGTAYEPSKKDSNSGGIQLKKSEPVQADATLETVTWNIEWYGDNDHGPDNEVQQTKNILQVTDSLKADLYAFEEVYNQETLDTLTRYMQGYHGFVADYIPYNQRMAFVFNTNTIDSLSSGPIQKVGTLYQKNWSYDWASGRLPMYFKFNYTYGNITIPFYTVVIHGKANTGDNEQERSDAYQRRKEAAKGLYNYLINNEPEANIIILGDYNDDVDVTIYDNTSESPYQPFVADSDSFRVVTQVLTEAGKSSTVQYPNIIDHITMSDELFPLYVDGSAAVFKVSDSFIPSYGNTTSDHFPVWAKFDITKSR
ncbi:MAG: hypothetical protein PVI44_05235 [Balneolaceae bacterium]